MWVNTSVPWILWDMTWGKRVCAEHMAILKLPFPPGGKVLSSDTGIMSQVSIDQLIENWWIFWGPVVWDSGDASK